MKLNTSGKRRVTVSDFNKNTMVHIREFWTNDAGELKPGKKVCHRCMFLWVSSKLTSVI